MALNDEYRESDLAISAFLVAKGFKLTGVVRDGGKRVVFCFEGKEGDTGQAALGYMQNESIPARALIAAERDLKTLIYTQKENENDKRRTRYR